VYLNCIEVFSYTEWKLLKYHGISKENFIYYLKEIEFIGVIIDKKFIKKFR